MSDDMSDDSDDEIDKLQSSVYKVTSYIILMMSSMYWIKVAFFSRKITASEISTSIMYLITTIIFFARNKMRSMEE